MKTSEFINKVEGLGYTTKVCDFWIDVSDQFDIKGTVFTKSFKIALSTIDINLIKLCLEYTETPFEEREEEKKYIVILPDPRNDGDYRYALCKRHDGIGIGHVHRSGYSKLTEAEIKRNHEYLWQFAKEVQE